MGDIKRFKKKYTTPMHPWNATRIGLEREIKRKYGVANKAEIWKMESKLTSFKDQAKQLLTRTDAQAAKELEQMKLRMVSLGLIKASGVMDDILGLQLRDIMNRRLQTLVLKKRLARSVKHARQLIVHEHISVGGKKITSPSYLVLVSEEGSIGYAPDSAMMQSEHPEAFSEELMQRKQARQRAKDKKRGVKTDEIVVFDESAIADPEAAAKDAAADASVADLAVEPTAENK
ncbi:TPA: 30S ribosomal protein S4 [Candidatus Woesearchaeota archaeon]|nr:30S ribosomal protein S4 [Candidatus Woesearchaeota archaeon]